MERGRDIDILQKAKMRQIPFSTPEGYFENMEERLREKILPNQPKGWWPSWAKTLKASLALAASFIIVAGLGWGVMKLTGQNQTTFASNTTELSEESFLLDSLLSRYGAIEVSQGYHNSLAEGYTEAPNILSEEEYDALEEYIALRTPSYPGLLAEELMTNR